jgi:hypothetical protein
MGYDAKTKPTRLSVDAHLGAIEDPTRRQDCREIAALMQRITGCEPTLWGPSIVGFDRYHYRYASGHEGESCVVGFAARKGDISLYLMGGYEGAEGLLAQLGKHKTGKACLYIKRLADVQLPILEQLIARSVRYVRGRYPQAPA